MLAKSQPYAHAYEDNMLFKHKPEIQEGQDIRTLPTYTIPEAAEYLGIDSWTLGSWYWGSEPLLKASGNYGDQRFALLSFRDIDEAYKLHLLRTKYEYSMQYLRGALVDARRESKSEHPLLEKGSSFSIFWLWISRSAGRAAGKWWPLEQCVRYTYQRLWKRGAND